MNKRPESLDDEKNSLDNPENVGDRNKDSQSKIKKDIPNQLQEANTQLSFKVNLLLGRISFSFHFHCFSLLGHS